MRRMSEYDTPQEIRTTPGECSEQHDRAEDMLDMSKHAPANNTVSDLSLPAC